MTESNKEILDALMRAMEIEKESFDFYTRAEQKTFNVAGKRMFRWLARMEEEHYQKFSQLYESFHESGRWVFYGGSSISPEETAEVTFDTNDREALDIAIGFESKGIAYFEELQRKTDDLEGKTMLKALLDEEREHLRILQEKRDAIEG